MIQAHVQVTTQQQHKFHIDATMTQMTERDIVAESPHYRVQVGFDFNGDLLVNVCPK